jgi:hypothetical protein
VLPGLVEFGFEFLLLVIEDFQEEHPDQLPDALCVTVNPGFLAHDVLWI